MRAWADCVESALTGRRERQPPNPWSSAYRWSGFLAMPVAMTWSICGDNPGTIVDGRGGGSVR